MTTSFKHDQADFRYVIHVAKFAIVYDTSSDEMHRVKVTLVGRIFKCRWTVTLRRQTVLVVFIRNKPSLCIADAKPKGLLRMDPWLMQF